VLVNEINALGVKNITDLNINRKILQSLRKPDYDLVKAIIYEKKLEYLKTSHILSKIMAVDVKSVPHAKHTTSRISWLHTRGSGVRIRKRASQFFLKLTKDENS
jgi:hypothetical protein